jgi:hypothetical protein
VAWDPNRPVPWKRLVREWVLYVLVIGVSVYFIAWKDQPLGGLILGLVISGPVYVALGAVMAKMGYQRKSLRQARADAIAARSATQSASRTTSRPKPAPTRRTGGGGGNQRRR